MLKVEFDTSSIFARLERADRAIGDLTPLHQQIGDYLITATRQRFVDGKAPDGSAWAPKKPATIARYVAQGDRSFTRPLIASGRLSSEIAMFASSESVEIGSNEEYSAVMQSGAGKGAFGADPAGRPIPWGAIPARVWLGLSETDESAIVEFADEFLADALDE